MKLNGNFQYQDKMQVSLASYSQMMFRPNYWLDFEESSLNP